MFGKKPLDFLSLGDITTDAFIRLSEAHVQYPSGNHENSELCIRFADKIPYEFVEVIRSVGNAPNAAVSAARLGLRSGLVTNLGDDQNGDECRAVLYKEGVDTRYVKVHKGAKTNYHYVLWYESERTILIKHEAYDYKLPEFNPAPRWLYLSSFRGTEQYHAEVMEYIEKEKGVRVAFQPGKFEINLGTQKLARLYARTEVFICNKEEAEKILGLGEGTDIKTILSGIHALGPKFTLITDGPEGAYLHDGTEALFMPPYPDPKAPYERTGAGDAYASTFVSALALGKTPEEALKWAGVNSMSVVQDIGAQRGLLTRAKIDEYLKTAPADYRSKPI